MLRSRIDIYVQSKTLDERIAETVQQLEQESESSERAESYRRLAMMLDAALRSAEATDAIEESMRLAPDRVSSLTVAAEIYVKSSRHSDAISVYRRLAAIDGRFRSNYLQNIAGLQVQLGQVEQALETAAEWIESQSGSSQPYRFYADICFQADRDPEGIEMLRRALRAAPRDDEARISLAQALADQNRTDEAIELYWQSFDATDDIEDLKWIVAKMATLYQRDHDLIYLIGRLEQQGRKSSDMRTASFLVAEAQRATNDLRGASRTLQPLLIDNPRDVELLRQLVQLATQAEDFPSALDFQEQLTFVSDTPENRHALLQLMIRSGRTRQIEKVFVRMQGLEDPASIVSLVDNLMDHGDYGAAIRICRLALQHNEKLWEVQVRMAFLLVLVNQLDEAIELVDAVRALPISNETLAISRANPSPSAGASSVATTTKMPRYIRAQSSRQFAAAFKIGRYANDRTSQRSKLSQTLRLPNFGFARFAALAIRLAVAEKQGKLDETIESIVGPKEAVDSNDAEELWLAFEAFSIRAIYAPSDSSRFFQIMGFSEKETPLDRVGWKLAEIDPDHGRDYVLQRLSLRHQIRVLSSRPKQGQLPIPELEPLSDEQLEMVLRMIEPTSQESQTVSHSNFKSNYYNLRLRGWVYGELVAAEKVDAAREIARLIPTHPKSVSEALIALFFWMQLDDKGQVNQLLSVVRSKFEQWVDDADAVEIAELQRLFSTSTLGTIVSHTDLADLMIAIEVVTRRPGAPPGRTPSRSKPSTIKITTIRNNRMVRAEIRAPISSRLLSTRFVQYAFMSLPLDRLSDDHQSLLTHLQDDVTVFTDHSDRAAAERRLRRIFAAYASWWAGDFPHAHQLICELCKDFPNDMDLLNERERMAAEIEAGSEQPETIPERTRSPQRMNAPGMKTPRMNAPQRPRIVNPFEALRRKGLHPQPAN